MSIKVSSTTDSEEAVTAENGQTVTNTDEGSDDQESALEASASDETTEESETSDDEEIHNDEDDEVEVEAKIDDGKKPKKVGGYQRKINKLTARASQAQQEADYWRQEALKSQKPTVGATQVAPEKVEAAGKPKAEDFEKHEEFVEALSEWKVDQKLSARDASAKATQVKTEHQKLVEAHVGRVEKFKATQKDFDTTLESVDDIPMSVTVQQVIIDSENGPELMFALAKNRDEFERICALPAIAAARELGKLEATLTKAAPVVEKKTSKAPKPITPVGAKASSAGKKTLDDPNLSQREFDQLMNEREARRAKSAW